MSAKILVVDDEEAIRITLSEILAYENYNVVTAPSGRDAVEKLTSEEFDLMLLDIRMPEMDGVEVMKKAGEISPDTQIVMVTGHGSLDTAIEALRHDVHDYLLKPQQTGGAQQRG